MASVFKRGRWVNAQGRKCRKGTSGAVWQESRFYTVQVFNRTGGRLPFEIRAVSPAGATVTSLGLASEVQPHALLEGRLLLAVPPSLLTATATPVRFDLRVDGGAVQHIDSSFIGPGRPKD